MKVIRSTDWTPVCWFESFPYMDGPVYVFLNKRFHDIVALNAVKYVDVPANDVFIYDASNRTISLSCDDAVENESSLPSYSVMTG